jgi:hypothetical protein
MHRALDAAQVRYKEKITAARTGVLTVDGKTLVTNLRGQSKTFNDFWEDADMEVINDAYRRSARIISPDIARSYTECIAFRNGDPGDLMEEALVEARVEIAALGLVPEVQPYFDGEAEKLTKTWLDEYRVAIKNLPHDRQEAYREIRQMSREPQDVDLVRPESRLEMTAARENETVAALPAYDNHLLCDTQGHYPAGLNHWEISVLQTEMQREGFSFWYRNPQQPGQSSLGVAFLDTGQYKIVRPDFIFFARRQDGTVVADIVDPHGTYLGDALSKLQGLAVYAEAHEHVYRRVESIAEVGGKLRVLDLTRKDVRKAIAAATSVTGLYGGELASDYR